MPAVQLLSEQALIGEPSSVEREFRVTEAEDFEDALDALEPFLVDYLPINNSGSLFVPLAEREVKRLNSASWTARVVWRGPTATGSEGEPDDDGAELEFSTVGDTRHVSHSENSIVFTYKGSFPIGEKSVILPDADGRPNGIDVPEGAFAWSETWQKPAAWLTPTRAALLRDLTRKRNAATFRSYGAGEVLFLGISRATRQGSGPWRVTFPFATMSERTATWNAGTAEEFAATVAPFALVDLRTETFPTVDENGSPIHASRPYAAVIHELYPTASFAGLDIG